MKNLAQLGTQLLAIWRQLGINQRISVAVAAIMVIGGMLCLALWSNRADMALLFGGLEETEAAKVIAILEETKTKYKPGAGGTSIYVPADKVYKLRMQMVAKGIPNGGSEGYSLIDKNPFATSDFVQRVNYMRAVQGELSRTLTQMDEIESARVMIVKPDSGLLVDPQKRATASVFVKVKRQMPLSAQTVNSIRFLVANSVEGLNPNNVSVIENSGRMPSENSDPDSAVGLTKTQLDVRRNVEHYLASKAEDLLRVALGPGQAVVRVSADINFDQTNRKETTYSAEDLPARMSTTTDETTVTATAVNGGVAGVTANINPDTNNAASSPVNNSNVKKKSTMVENAVPEITTSVLQAPGGIKRLSAAVFVAAKMEGTGTDRKVVPRTEDELKRLRSVVQSAIGLQLNTGGGRQDELNLEEVQFNDQNATEVTQQLDKQEQREFWWQTLKNLIYPALAFGVLAFFWRAFKQTPAENIPIGIPLGMIGANGNGHGNGNGNGHGHNFMDSHGEAGKHNEPGVVTVDVLNRLVHENPDNMSQAIRAWLSRGKPNVK